MKSSTVVIIIVILLIFGGVIYFTNQNQETLPGPDLTGPEADVVSVNYLCEDERAIAATYNNEEENVSLSLSDEREMTLGQVIAASGARYANEDESIVFWSSGNEAFVEEDGEITFANCLAEGAPAPEQDTQPEAEVETEDEAPAEDVLEESVEDEEVLLEAEDVEEDPAEEVAE